MWRAIFIGSARVLTVRDVSDKGPRPPESIRGDQDSAQRACPHPLFRQLGESQSLRYWPRKLVPGDLCDRARLRAFRDGGARIGHIAALISQSIIRAKAGVAQW